MSTRLRLPLRARCERSTSRKPLVDRRSPRGQTMRSQDPMDVPLLGASVHPLHPATAVRAFEDVDQDTFLINQAHGFLLGLGLSASKRPTCAASPSSEADSSARQRCSGLGTTSERSFALGENTP
jgi:hypothetical protein